MDIYEYFQKMKNIEENILSFIDNERSDDLKFAQLAHYFKKQNVCINKCLLIGTFHLISSISKHHHRTDGFFDKIIKILLIFTNSIQQYFTQTEIFNIFSSSQKLILFLIEQKIIIPNKYVIDRLYEINYHKYFYPEFIEYNGQPSINAKIRSTTKLSQIYSNIYPISTFQKKNEESIEKVDITEDFMKNRLQGENESYICSLIRKDSIENFISYVNRETISVNYKIIPTIFETNFLLKSETSLIEYSAFFGSIQIFKYLKNNDAKIESKIWLYAIHSNNPEIINEIEQLEFMITEDLYEKIFYESVLCHHYEIADYIKSNHSYGLAQDQYINFIVENYNYILIPESIKDNKEMLKNFIQFDYYPIVEYQKKELNNDLFQFSIENEKIDVLNLFLTNNKELINSRFLISSKNKHDEKLNMILSPLIMAIDTGNQDLVSFLLSQKDIDVNFPLNCTYVNSIIKKYNTEKMQPYCYAISKGNNAILNLLLNHPKTEINTNVNFNKSPLAIALFKNNFEAFNTLISFHQDFKRLFKMNKEQIYKYLIINNNFKFFINLMKIHGYKSFEIEPNDWIVNVPISLLNFQKDDAYKSLFPENANENISLLQFAIEIGNVELVDTLLSFPEVDVNKYFEKKNFEQQFTRIPLTMIYSCTFIKYTPLSFAILNQNVDVIKCLLKRTDLNLNLVHKTIRLNIKYHSKLGANGGGWVRDGDEVIKQNDTYYQIANNTRNDEIIRLITKRKK